MDTLSYKIFIILIVGVILNICKVSAASRNPSDCCLATNDKKLPYKLISTYKHQGLFSGCNIPAIVFTTHKNRHLCAPTNSDWVKKYMRCLDQKVKKCWSDKGRSGGGSHARARGGATSLLLESPWLIHRILICLSLLSPGVGSIIDMYLSP